MSYDITAAGREDLGKLLLRATPAILILFHGVAKLSGGVEGIAGMLQGAGLPAALAYGVFLGEVVGPVLVLVGWYARVGAALIAINMLFAIGLGHADEIFALNDHGAWAIELQAFFLFTAIAVMLIGPGRLRINDR